MNRNLRRAICLAICLAWVLSGFDKADATTEPVRTVQLVALATPGNPAPTDARMNQELADIVDFWDEFVTIEQVGGIDHVIGMATKDSGTQFASELPTQTADTMIVVTEAKTMACYTAKPRIVINHYGDCGAHEYGHILGLGHSNAILPGLGLSEYGDLHSVMGSGDGSATYSQLRYLGYAPEPVHVTPDITGVILRSMNIRTRTALHWDDCWVEYRRDTAGTELSLYTTTDGRTTTTQTTIAPGHTASFCGYRLSLNAHPTGIARVTLEPSL